MCIAVSATCLPRWCAAAEVHVDTVDALQSAVSAAAPGDTIVVAPGTYTRTIRLSGQGEDGARITVKASPEGIVTIDSTVLLSGAYLSLEGFDFAENSRLEFSEGVGHRVWACHFEALKAGHWVRFKDEATRCEVGYCSFTDDDNTGETGNQQIIQILRSDATGPDYHHIHHNYFADVTPGMDNNGFETIQMFHGAEGGRGSSRSVVEYNVFERCNGETEMISVKCSDNIIRKNLILECQGGLVLRKGDNNLIDGNVFIGNHVKGTAGIRFRGDGQTIINNFMYQLSYTAISLHNGDPDYFYEPITEATIAFNTIVDCGRALNIGVRHADLDSSIVPTGVILANNILVSTGRQILDSDGAMQTWTVEGNLAFGTTPEVSDLTGFTVADPLLETLPGGILAPAPGSPAIGAAQGSFPTVSHDILGNSRPAVGKTIGAVEVALPEFPVTRAVVGPEALEL